MCFKQTMRLFMNGFLTARGLFLAPFPAVAAVSGKKWTFLSMSSPNLNPDTAVLTSIAVPSAVQCFQKVRVSKDVLFPAYDLSFASCR